MSYEDIPTQNVEDDFTAPDWLIHKLELAGDYQAFSSDDQPAVSVEFQARAREEAELAFTRNKLRSDTLNKLRSECEKIGFVPLSIGDYVRGIAKVENLSLLPILDWLGIPNLFHPEPQSAKGFAQLGLELGLGFSEIMAHIRIALAAFAGISPIPLLMARQRSSIPGRNDLQACISVLEEVEAKYDPSRRNELHLIETEIRAVYQQETQ